MKSIMSAMILLSSISYTYSMEVSKEKWKHNTYKNVPITSENIYQLSPKPNAQLQLELNEFWDIAENRALIKMLNTFNSCKSVEELKSAIEAQKKFMEQQGIKNLSSFNYVFKVKDKNNNVHNFVIKIAGPFNIIRTRISTVFDVDPYAKKVSEFDIEKVTSEPVEIYQHVSAMAHYLRLFEIARSFKYLKVAPTYLFPISNSIDVSCHDQNCIIIQELIEDEEGVVVLHKLTAQEIKEILDNLPEQAIKEIYLAIKHAALWDFWANLMVNKKDKQTLWISDLEQPNYSNNNYFFFNEGKTESNWIKGRNHYEAASNCGLQNMGKTLEASSPKQYQLWQELTKRDWQEFYDEMTKSL
ncbi:hypothetical protein M1446_02695 [Candidatus Dependentiae bacterium]|nr:hypothetical protein [Candidatus Dependentiae bacterium]